MVIKQSFSVDYHYDIIFTRDLFSPKNDTLLQVLTQGKTDVVKIIFVLDEGLVSMQSGLISAIEQYLVAFPEVHLLAHPLVVSGGEESKNSTKEFVRTLEMIDSAKVDRHAYVVAVGGGAVLDMVGFAAAVAHRGIRHIRIPSTTLSQNDSGVGVKNGINYFGKKNFLGTFAPPFAVINDLDLLDTLDDRDWRAGIAEAVKVALIKDAAFFHWIEQHISELNQRESASIEHLIVRCAELHSEHIGGSDDPFEMGSSRPLDFGHWAAHKIEQLSDFELRHGEAVAIGIALDILYAAEAHFLDSATADRIVDVLSSLGFQLFHPTLVDQNGGANALLLKGLEEFREHLGGELTIPMISSIGVKFDVHEMDESKIDRAVKRILKRHKAHA